MVCPVFKILFLLGVMSNDSLKGEFCDPSEPQGNKKFKGQKKQEALFGISKIGNFREILLEKV